MAACRRPAGHEALPAHRAWLQPSRLRLRRRVSVWTLRPLKFHDLRHTDETWAKKRDPWLAARPEVPRGRAGTLCQGISILVFYSCWGQRRGVGEPGYGS